LPISQQIKEESPTTTTAQKINNQDGDSQAKIVVSIVEIQRLSFVVINHIHQIIMFII
jgi:hypothetical protein